MRFAVGRCYRSTQVAGLRPRDAREDPDDLWLSRASTRSCERYGLKETRPSLAEKTGVKKTKRPANSDLSATQRRGQDARNTSRGTADATYRDLSFLRFRPPSDTGRAFSFIVRFFLLRAKGEDALIIKGPGAVGLRKMWRCLCCRGGVDVHDQVFCCLRFRGHLCRLWN
jgi:hypothetical protein